jgi:hypothetical protein
MKKNYADSILKKLEKAQTFVTLSSKGEQNLLNSSYRCGCG